MLNDSVFNTFHAFFSIIPNKILLESHLLPGYCFFNVCHCQFVICACEIKAGKKRKNSISMFIWMKPKQNQVSNKISYTIRKTWRFLRGAFVIILWSPWRQKSLALYGLWYKHTAFLPTDHWVFLPCLLTLHYFPK